VKPSRKESDLIGAVLRRSALVWLLLSYLLNIPRVSISAHYIPWVLMSRCLVMRVALASNM